MNTSNGSTTFLKNIGAAFVSVAARGDGATLRLLDGNDQQYPLEHRSACGEHRHTARAVRHHDVRRGWRSGRTGLLYTSDTTTGTLYQINTTLGTATAVGGRHRNHRRLRLRTQRLSTFYGFASDQTIRAVNTATGSGGTPVAYSFGTGQELDIVTAVAGAVIPEPGTLSLLLLGLSGAAGVRCLRARRRRA